MSKHSIKQISKIVEIDKLDNSNPHLYGHLLSWLGIGTSINKAIVVLNWLYVSKYPLLVKSYGQASIFVSACKSAAFYYHLIPYMHVS